MDDRPWHPGSLHQPGGGTYSSGHDDEASSFIRAWCGMSLTETPSKRHFLCSNPAHAYVRLKTISQETVLTLAHVFCFQCNADLF